ncbi:MAG: SDR family oxidoreductase [Bryobacteraceae bacterium]
MQIEDRVFIVTGASSGIGRSTAIALTGRGAKVALLARSTDPLEELSQQLPGSLPFTVDMTQFGRVRDAIGAVQRSSQKCMSDVVQGPAMRLYPASILMRQAQHQFGDLAARRRPPWISSISRAVELLRDQFSIPGQDGVRLG